MLHKVWAIAVREYRAAVQSKAFILSLVLMPVIWGGSIGLQRLVKKAEDRSTKKFAVIDRTQRLRPALDKALERRNAVEIYDRQTGEQHSAATQVVRRRAEEKQCHQQHDDVDREQQREGGRREPELELVDSVKG